MVNWPPLHSRQQGLAAALRRLVPALFDGDRVFGAVNGALVIALVASMLYPFLYIAAVSMSSGPAVTSGRVVLWPVDTTFAAYGQVLSDRLFWIAYANTVLYATVGTVVSLALIVPGAYALSRPRLMGRRVLNFLVAFTLWFHAGMIPFFLNMRDLGLIDSRLGIIIGFACSAFNVILLRNTFEGLAPSFEEAARLEGAGEFQLLAHVFVPLSMPAMLTVALLCLVTRWNGYFWAMVLLRGEEKIPLQVYLKRIIVDLRADDAAAARLAQASDYSFETIMAAIIVVSLVPIVAVYPYLLKHFNKGMTLGGIKE